MSDVSTANATDILHLTAENMNEAVRGLPRRAALLLRNLTRLQYGSLELTIPGGRTIRYEAPKPGPHAQGQIHDWGIVARVITSGSLGLAESYIEGEWDSPDVTGFLEMFLVNSYGGGGESFFNRNRLMNLISKLIHFRNRNSKSGSKRNISAHYDLGNAFYSQWLDPSMTYSSALFSDGANSLEEAQRAKYAALAEAIDIRPEHHVLEIGCGWGGFAHYVAGEIGARVTCLTISQEQYDYAVQRMKEAGLDDRVTIKFQDYRDETGRYDRIGSIEMFEAVGEAYWPSFFQQVRDRLRPQGRAGVQVITIKDEDYDWYRANPDFIQKYVFPGGQLPSAAIMRELGDEHGVPQIATRAFGRDYGETLRQWNVNFHAAWDTIKPLGFDTRFRRIWEFYLHYCEAGFRAGSIDVRQIIYEKPA